MAAGSWHKWTAEQELRLVENRIKYPADFCLRTANELGIKIFAVHERSRNLRLKSRTRLALDTLITRYKTEIAAALVAAGGRLPPANAGNALFPATPPSCAELRRRAAAEGRPYWPAPGHMVVPGIGVKHGMIN